MFWLPANINSRMYRVIKPSFWYKQLCICLWNHMCESLYQRSSVCVFRTVQHRSTPVCTRTVPNVEIYVGSVAYCKLQQCICRFCTGTSVIELPYKTTDVYTNLYPLYHVPYMSCVNSFSPSGQGCYQIAQMGTVVL